MQPQLDRLKAFADLTRLRLLHLLSQRGPGICVCDLVEVLGLPQSTVSRQIAPLRMLGLVQGRHRGPWVYYSLAEPADEFHRSLIGCLEHCAGEGTEFSEDLGRFDRLIEQRALVCCQPLDAERSVPRETEKKAAIN